MEKTKVQVAYRMLDGEVIALFPNIDFDNKGNITSYMHVGQHSGASPDLLHNPKAPPAKYRDLHDELESIGYEITPIL